MSIDEAVVASRGLAHFAGTRPRVVWDPFILPQGFAPGRRRLATRTAALVRLTGPGLVDELREGPGGAGTQTRAGSGTMGA